MAVLAPMAGPPAMSSLQGWYHAGLRWWLLEDEPGETGAAINSLAALVEGGALERALWVAAIEGTGEEIRYVTDAVGAAAASRSGGGPVVLGRLDGAGCLGLLDAAVTVPIGFSLAQVDAGAGDTAAATMRGDGGARCRPRLVAHRPPQAGWMALGTPGDEPPPLRARLLQDLARIPGPEGSPTSSCRRRVLSGPGPAAAAGLALLGLIVGLAIDSGSRQAPASTPSGSAGTPPAARLFLEPPVPATGPGPTIAFDPANSQVVLVGGAGSASTTWLWDGRRWRPAASAVGPSGRIGAAVAYDPEMRRLLLFGGRRAQGGGALNDTWSWDGARWQQLASGSGGPTAGAGALIAWDGVRGQMVLVTGAKTGSPAQTWIWAGSNWSRRRSDALPVFDTGLLAFDPVSQTDILVVCCPVLGRPEAESTWSWDGSAWSHLLTAAVPGSLGAMGLDPHSGRLLLWGSPVSLSPAWSWDGRGWAGVATSGGPAATIAVTSDPRRGSLELVGFAGAPDARHPLEIGIWVWTGTEWLPVSAGA